jgi:hypothetical protein
MKLKVGAARAPQFMQMTLYQGPCLKNAKHLLT